MNDETWFPRFAEILGIEYEPPKGLDFSRLPGRGKVPEISYYDFDGKRRKSLMWKYGDVSSGASPAHDWKTAPRQGESEAATLLRQIYETLELPGTLSDYHFALQRTHDGLNRFIGKESWVLAEIEKLCWINVRLLEKYPETISYENDDGFHLQKQVFFNPRRHEVDRIPVKLAAHWIIKNHYLGSFPLATVCYGIFRSGKLSGVAVLGTAQHKNTIPNVFGPSHARDCLLLQRFALEDVLEFNAESYFLARVRASLKREGYCGILTMSDETPKNDITGNIIFPTRSILVRRLSKLSITGACSPTANAPSSCTASVPLRTSTI